MALNNKNKKDIFELRKKHIYNSKLSSFEKKELFVYLNSLYRSNNITTSEMNNKFNENYTPQISYEDFCNQHQELIRDEMQNLNMESEEIMQNKIKKTYKNRFYVIIRQKKQKISEESEDDEIEETII